MSQNRHSRLKRRLQWIWPIIYVALLVLWLVFQPATAQANSNSLQPRHSIIYKAKFENTQFNPERTLDWRNPNVRMTFNLPDNDWVDNLELLISARPDGKVNRSDPLMVKFNDADPVPLYPRGKRFDARIKLDKSALKLRNNVVTFMYLTPENKTCLGPESGAWTLDVKSSSVVVKAHTTSRKYSFSDFKTRLNASATAPRSASIIAKGKNKLQLQVLAAQGIALNMDTPPAFKTNRAKSGLEIILATRRQLKGLIKSADIPRGDGPAVAIVKNRPTQVVITGDTEEEVIQGAKAFARNPLPHNRSSRIRPADIEINFETLKRTKLKKGIVNLSSLGPLNFGSSWNPQPQTLSFDVVDPSAMSGTLELNINAGPLVRSDKSILSVSLNGQELGIIPLKKTRKTQAVQIPAGALKAIDNRLVFKPALQSQSVSDHCRLAASNSGFSIGTKSRIELTPNFQSAKTDLSRFAATGLPFSHKDGTNVNIRISARNAAELHSVLGVMAQLVKASGIGFAGADIRPYDRGQLPENGDLFLIGSNIRFSDPALKGAPKSLVNSVASLRRETPVNIQTATHMDSKAKLPLRILSTQKTIKGGVAALYTDTHANGRVVGIVTNMRGQSLTASLRNLVKNQIWNELEGSVARWNASTVMMTQTAAPMPLEVKKSSFKWPKLFGPKNDRSATTVPTQPPAANVNVLPDISVPQLNVPRLNLRRESSPRHTRQGSIPIQIQPANTTPIQSPQDQIISFIPDPPKLPSEQNSAISKSASDLLSDIRYIGSDFYKVVSSGLKDFMAMFSSDRHSDGTKISPNILVFAALMTMLLLMTTLISPAGGRKKSRR